MFISFLHHSLLFILSILPIFQSSSFPNSILCFLIPTVSCYITKPPTIVTISISLIHLYSIWIMWCQLCLLIWAYYDHICSLYSFHWSWPCQCLLLSVMGQLDTNNFYFIFFYFSDFTFLFFFFLFFWRTMKKACDKEVTWQVTWCDVISLELNERV